MFGTTRLIYALLPLQVSAKNDVNIAGIFRELLAQVDLQLVPDMRDAAVEEQRKAKYFARLKRHPKLAKRNSCQVSWLVADDVIVDTRVLVCP